jgi:Ca-activated chloride channel family protein
MSARLRLLTVIFLLFSSITGAQDVQLRTRVELVVVPVSVRDKSGKLVGDMSREDFSISEAGKRQSITQFSIDPVPLSVVLVIDTGVTEFALQNVKNSFPALLGAFSEDDEVAIYRFDKHVERVLDFTYDRVQLEKTFAKLQNATPSASSSGGGPFSVPGPVINGAPIIPGVQSAGRSPNLPTKVLHDAMFDAAEYLGTRPIDRRRIIVLASDGRNQNSKNSYETALDRLLLHEVHVFALGVDTSLFQRLRSTLLNYAKGTGGESWFPDSQGAIELCYSLSTEAARNQYVLGYVSTNKRPAGRAVFREIKVAVTRTGTDVRHRKGYFQSP